MGALWDRYRDSLNRSFDYSGRTSVETFNILIWPTQFLLLFAIIAATSVRSEGLSIALFAATVTIGIVLLVPQVAASVRRLHDRDLSGRYLPLIIVPIVNLWLIYQLFQPGDDDHNEYGEPPDV